MAFSRDKFRRCFGGVCLVASVGMVILGQTVLKDRLHGADFIQYWLICVVVTWVTLITALLDMRVVRKRSKREQTELIQNALKGIAEDEQKTRKKTG